MNLDAIRPEEEKQERVPLVGEASEEDNEAQNGAEVAQESTGQEEPGRRITDKPRQYVLLGLWAQLVIDTFFLINSIVIQIKFGNGK